MPVDLLLKGMKGISTFRRHRFHFSRYHSHPTLNIGFLCPKNEHKYTHITLPLYPYTTAREVSIEVAEYLSLPAEYSENLLVFLLPYGFTINDHRILEFINLFPKNLVEKEGHIKLLAPRKPPFPSFPAKRYRGKTLAPDDKIMPLLTPWSPNALHIWVSLSHHDERIIRYQNAAENFQLVIQEKERTDRKCQNALKSEAIERYSLRYRIPLSRSRRNSYSEHKFKERKRKYRCQITDEYFTLDRMMASTIYPRSLMMELKELDEQVVDMLTGPENTVFLHQTLAEQFDSGAIAIIRRQKPQESDIEEVGYIPGDPEGMVETGGNPVAERSNEDIEQYEYFLKVHHTRLLGRNVFAKEDWEGRENRETLMWDDIDGKKIKFSSNRKIVPAEPFLTFHAEMAALIYEGSLPKEKKPDSEIEYLPATDSESSRAPSPSVASEGDLSSLSDTDPGEETVVAAIGVPMPVKV